MRRDGIVSREQWRCCSRLRRRRGRTWSANDGIAQDGGAARGRDGVQRRIAQHDATLIGTRSTSPAQTQLDVTVTIPPGGPCDSFLDLARMKLLDGDGSEIADADPDPGETQHILYTTPPGREPLLPHCHRRRMRRLRVPIPPRPRPGDRQRARDPSTGSDRGANEDAGQAFGPLAGGTSYAGRLDTQNDQDWFYFYAGGVGALNVAVTGTGGPSFCDTDATLYQSTDMQNSAASGDVDLNQTTPAPHRRRPREISARGGRRLHRHRLISCASTRRT